MRLFDPGRHEGVISAEWSADQALSVAHSIFDHLCAGRASETGLWRADPAEDSRCEFNKSLYNGAAGTLWTLTELSRRLSRPLTFAAPALSRYILDQYDLEPDTGEVVPSYFLGDTGILLLVDKLTKKPSTVLDPRIRLRDSIKRNTSNPVNEALWGSPGTMIPALRKGEESLYKSGAEYLFAQWHFSDKLGCWIWKQDLYGEIRELTGAGHGFFGNAYALLEGAQLLSEAQRELLYARVSETALKSAHHAGGLANWTPSFFPREEKPPLTQWCHGSPGVVTSLRSFPVGRSPELDQLLLEAGECIWQAGPLKKGIGLCHGTDGNGCAFLQLFERTRDELWLKRARSFAMRACEQRNGRFSLWTGEAGLALYLLDCVDGRAGLPALDYF